MEMQALQAAIALSETVSVDSDTSKVMETCTYQRRGRKQAKPSRALDSTEAPAEFQHSAAPKQQQSYLLTETSSGDSPIFNNQAGCEDTAVPIRVQQSVSSSKSGSKNSPAHRQGPCGHCKTPYSPQWRKGPRNKPVLCNACGIRYLRNRHLGRSVPQKKRSSMPTAKTAADDSSEAGEASVDTLTDTTDMRGPFKKRKTKKGDMGDEDTSAYSYDDSGLQETMGSVGRFQQLLLQQHVSYRDTERACADADTAARRGSDVSQSDKQNCAGPPASMQADVQAKQTPGPTFSTSLAMPGNMQQQLLAPMQSLASSSGIYGGGYSMALALQLYQQQQHQLLLNQQLLMSQASTEASGLQTQGSSAAGSAPASPAHSSAGQAGSAQANLLSAYNQSLQMQQLQGYLLQQQQHAHVLQAAGMLHGPSPLSVMSSGAVSSSLALGSSGQLSALQAPVSTAAVPAAPAVPSLEITPLVCGEKPVALSTAMPAQAHAAAADPAAAASIQVPAKTGNAVLGSFQSLLAA